MNLDIASTAIGEATGGTAGGGTGAFTVTQKSNNGTPQWVWFAAAALAAFLLWSRKTTPARSR